MYNCIYNFICAILNKNKINTSYVFNASVCQSLVISSFALKGNHPDLGINKLLAFLYNFTPYVKVPKQYVQMYKYIRYTRKSCVILTHCW